MTKTSKACWMVGFLAVVGVGCGDDDDNSTDLMVRDGGADGSIDASVRPDGSLDGAVDASARDGAADASAALSEGEIVGLASALNTGEVQVGELAVTKATRSDVRDFATMMVTMHSAANGRAALLGIAPVTSPASTQLQQMANTTRTSLENTPAGAEFDSAYIASQITMHTSALTLFDTMLLPNAKTPALKTELTDVRGDVAKHLEHAQTLRGDGGT